MAVRMGSDLKTTEEFLQSLELESLATLFEENNIDLNLLMDLSDDKLEAILIEMNLSIGTRYKIIDKIQKMKADDLSSNDIKLVTSGKEVYIQIGQHNLCQINISISDELKNEEESKSINDEGNLVNMTLNMHTATPGVCIAVLEERILQSLSGDQRKEINKVLLEKFGVEIVACKKGCVVLVLRKMIEIPKCLVDKNVLLEFLSTLFKLLGFSHDYHSEINLRVQLTSRDTADIDIFNESQLKKNGLQLVLSPKKKLKCMTEDTKKELVSCILSNVAGSNLGDKNSKLQTESHFIDKKPNHIKGICNVGGSNIEDNNSDLQTAESNFIDQRTNYIKDRDTQKGSWYQVAALIFNQEVQLELSCRTSMCNLCEENERKLLVGRPTDRQTDNSNAICPFLFEGRHTNIAFDNYNSY